LVLVLFLVPRSRVVGFGVELNSLWHGLGLEFRPFGLDLSLKRQILGLRLILGIPESWSWSGS